MSRLSTLPRVYIGRLSHRARERDVERFFKGFGKIVEVDLKNGYGFVEFEDMRDAEDAVYEMNGRDLCGERVIVEHARAPRREARSKFTICTFVLFSGALKYVLLLQFGIG